MAHVMAARTMIPVAMLAMAEGFLIHTPTSSSPLSSSMEAGARLCSLPRLRPSPCTTVHMSGFGGKSQAKSSKAPKKIMGIPKKHLESFDELIKAGKKPYYVFARVKGGDKWYECGRVATEDNSANAACTFFKRLILEYACDLYPVLMTKRNELEVGYSDDENPNNAKSISKETTEQACGFSPKAKSSRMTQGLFDASGKTVTSTTAVESSE